jgi:hypothetical protein
MLTLLIISLPAFPCERCKLECGNSALIEVCKDLGVDSGKVGSVTIDTSADLKKAAEKLGLKARWSYISADRLATVKGPFIAHVWGDHFVVVRSDGAGSVSVFDPSIASTDASKPQPISILTDLKTSFSGEVLFVSKGGELPDDVKPTGPAAVFEPYVVDFGEVFQSDEVAKTVTIRNVGSQDLVISEVRGTCGCQTAFVGEKTAAPGKSVEVQVKLATSARTGPQSLKFYVDSNSTDQPIAQVNLTGNIRPQNVSIYPSSLNFGLLRSGETVNRDIRISDPMGKGLLITEPKCDSPAVKLSLKKEGTADNPEYILTVSVSEAQLNENLQTKITLKSNYPKQKLAEIPVTAMLDQQSVTIKQQAPPPPQVSTPSVPVPVLNVFITGGVKGKELKHTIALKTPVKQAFKITKVDCPLYFLKVSIVPPKPVKDKKQVEKETKVIITLLKTTPAGTISGDIMLHTNDPKQPMIKLKVYGIVAEG